VKLSKAPIFLFTQDAERPVSIGPRDAFFCALLRIAGGRAGGGVRIYAQAAQDSFVRYADHRGASLGIGKLLAWLQCMLKKLDTFSVVSLLTVVGFIAVLVAMFLYAC
jgi:hypothetical protein